MDTTTSLGVTLFIVAIVTSYGVAVAGDDIDTGSEAGVPEDDIGDRKNPPDYCEAETFRASCLDDEVILIKYARYGRMRDGRCVVRNYGYLGCSANVLPHLDWKCSGKQECEVRIPDKALDMVNPCPKDLKTYLEVEYECIKVVTPPCHACSMSNHSAVVSGQSGHLASTVVKTSGCGTGLCPWVIKEQGGRRINLTLYDFSVPEGEMADSSRCDRLALVREVTSDSGSRNQHAVELCSGWGRETHVYTSHNSVIEVLVDPRFMAGDVTGEKRFIIKYQAFGCPDLAPPTNAWLKRDGDSLEVGCRTTESVYHLVCDGNKWTGTIGSCPQTVSGDDNPDDPLHGNHPMGIMVAIAIGIALIIGSLVLTVGLVYVRRRSRPTPRQPPPSSIYSPQDSRLVLVSKSGGYCSAECHKACYQAILASKHPPNDYEYAMEMRPLPDAPETTNTGSCYDTRTCSASFTRQMSCRSMGLAGVHCNPAFQRVMPTYDHSHGYSHRRPDPGSGSHSRICRHYFELEPEHVDIVTISGDAVPNKIEEPPPVATAKSKVTTEMRQNKTNRGKEFTRQRSYNGPLLTTFGKGSTDSSNSVRLLDNDNSNKFSWP